MAKEAVVTIFGCRHSKELAGRADISVNLVFQDKIDPIFIFTGKESSPTKDIIKIFGNDRVLWEDKSTTTEENVANVLEVLKKHWINDLKRVWVSSWYHIPRIKLFLHRAGVDVSRETFVKSYSGINLINVLVEPLALLVAWLNIGHRPEIKAIKRTLGYNV